MHQRDYILRMIEQAGLALIRLRKLVFGGGASGSEIETEMQAVVGMAGLDLDLVRSVSDDTLLLMIAPTGEVDLTRCWVLAETFYLDGVHAHLAGRAEDARRSLERAGKLYSMLDADLVITGLPEASERLDEISARLEALAGPGSSPPPPG